MNDLIEHLKASGDLGQRAVKLIEQLLADSNIQQTRIAELKEKLAKGYPQPPKESSGKARAGE